MTGTKALYSVGIIEDLKNTLNNTAPPVTSVIPGYKRPAKNLPGLVVAHFTTLETNDGLMWGKALSEVIRRNLNYSPVTWIHMPSLRWNVVLHDVWQAGMPDEDRLQSLESLRLAYKRTGVKYALTGDFFKNSESFELKLRILNLPKGSLESEQIFRGVMKDLPGQVKAAIIWVATSLHSAPTPDIQTYINYNIPMRTESLEDYARLVTEWNTDNVDEARLLAFELSTKEPAFSSIGAALIELAEPTYDIFSANQYYLDLAEQYQHDIGIQVASAAAFKHGDRVDLGMQRATWLKNIIKHDPNHLMAFLLLADTLAETGQQLAATSVASEALKRWPDNYRTWWTFAYTMQRYAWYFRGNKRWINVSAKGKQMFPALNKIGLRALDHASELHSDMSQIWVLRMRLISKYTPEFLKAYREALRANPQNPWVYWYGLAFSAPKWAGSLDEQMQILDAAVTHNRGKTWPFRYYNQLVKPGLNIRVWMKYALLRVGCYGKCKNYFSIVLVLVVILGSIVFIQRNSFR